MRYEYRVSSIEYQVSSIEKSELIYFNMHSDIICGLDIGASSVRAVIGRLEFTHPKGKNKDSSMAKEEILGYAEAPTKGFSKSVVSNLSLLSDAIEASISKAEDMAGFRARKVISNISGAHIRTFQSRGSIHISDRPSEITKSDISRCIDSAKFIAMSLDREQVHLVPVRFFIDDKMEIDEPLGLFGSKLDVDLNIITSLVTVLQNLTKAINLAGYEVEDMIVSGAGTALAIFDKQELENGSVLIDVGKEVTGLTIFVNGRLRDSFYFPFGGDDLTQVLQDKLKIMFEEAEELKIKYGAITRDLTRIDDSEILMPSLKRMEAPATKIISKSEIANLLLLKAQAMLEDVHKKLEPFLKDKKSLPHVSIVGAVARTDGFIETVEEILNVPVNMARIKGSDDLKDISFACSLGLMRYGINKITARKPRYAPSEAGNAAAKVLSRVKAIFSEYF